MYAQILTVPMSRDVLAPKAFQIPAPEEFKQALDEAQQWAKSVGYREEDVNDIIKSVRNGKRA